MEKNQSEKGLSIIFVLGSSHYGVWRTLLGKTFTMNISIVEVQLTVFRNVDIGQALVSALSLPEYAQTLELSSLRLCNVPMYHDLGHDSLVKQKMVNHAG